MYGDKRTICGSLSTAWMAGLKLKFISKDLSLSARTFSSHQPWFVCLFEARSHCTPQNGLDFTVSPSLASGLLHNQE